MKKIGIMGTHGVGKTRMVLNMAAAEKNRLPYLRVETISEIARSCPMPINNNATPESQNWIYHAQILAEIIGAHRANVLICDRTILDVCAYSERLGFLDQNHLNLALAHMDTYHEIHFLRPNGTPPAADGVRDIDPQFQADIDKILAGWISRYKINVITKNEKRLDRPAKTCNRNGEISVEYR